MKVTKKDKEIITLKIFIKELKKIIKSYQKEVKKRKFFEEKLMNQIKKIVKP